MDITTAATQYFSRPKDERFPSLQALIEHGAKEKAHSKEVGYNLKDLHVQGDDAKGLILQSPKGEATFSPWSFDQLSRLVGAPAGYLRKLPASLTARNLQHGFDSSPIGSTASLLLTRREGTELPVVRAATSGSYGRVWGCDLHGGIQQAIKGEQWGLPPTWDGIPAGAYEGDRDSFLIYCNGGSIVNDPSAGHDGRMSRGLLVKNSEVGASAVVIEAILYRYVCGNHNLWGAVVDKSFRRRHIGVHALRDTIREIGSLAHKWANKSGNEDEALIKLLISHELASTREAIVDELRTMGASKEQAERAYDKAESTEQAGPRSYWGLSQGLTRLSQESGFQDERFEIDKIALAVLKRGRQLVTA